VSATAAIRFCRPIIQRCQRAIRPIRHVGGKTTFRIAPALLFPETDTKLKGSVGTGFKAPTLAELFQNFPSFNFLSNPNLKPETSIGFDLGFEQTLLEKRLQFGATYFHNNI
jgi:vitamin B12 transporter